MMKYYQNEELFKKPEVSIFRNMARILEKPVFRGFQGAVPPDLPPSGGLTATGFPYDEILSK